MFHYYFMNKNILVTTQSRTLRFDICIPDLGPSTHFMKSIKLSLNK